VHGSGCCLAVRRLAFLRKALAGRAGAAAFCTDVDREVSPTEPDFSVLLGVASSDDVTVPLPAN